MIILPPFPTLSSAFATSLSLLTLLGLLSRTVVFPGVQARIVVQSLVFCQIFLRRKKLPRSLLAVAGPMKLPQLRIP